MKDTEDTEDKIIAAVREVLSNPDGEGFIAVRPAGSRQLLIYTDGAIDPDFDDTGDSAIMVVSNGTSLLNFIGQPNLATRATMKLFSEQLPLLRSVMKQALEYKGDDV